MRIRTLAVLALASLSLQAGELRLATFRADVTPQMGQPMIPLVPTKEVLDPLYAKGVIIDDGKTRVVLCTIDWCGAGGRTHQLFRSRLAKAAGAKVENTALQAVHQHAAPYVYSNAFDVMKALGVPTQVEYTDSGLEELASRLAAAAHKAVGELRPFDQVGLGEARVERVGSARRLKGPKGEPVTRWSGSGNNAELAAAPEGDIDPVLKTITLAKGAKPMVRLHFYATHPQTFCCDGRVSGDIVNMAREKFEKEEGVFQIYFTGAAGDTTVGKYNDRTAAAQAGLAERLYNGLKASSGSTKYSPAKQLAWADAPLTLPKRLATPAQVDAAKQELKKTSADADRLKAANIVAFAERKTPLEVQELKLGPARALFLPGEPLLEFQRFAQSVRPKEFVALAGYGDVSVGYICPDKAYDEGGYEPSASATAPGAETALKHVIQTLLKQ